MIWTYDGYLHMSSQPRNFQIIGVSQSFSRVISGIRGHTRTRPHHTPSQTRTVRLPPFNTRLSTRSRERLNCGFVRSVSPSPQRTGRSHAALCPVAGTAWARGRDCMLTFVIRSSIIAHRQNVCLDCVGLSRCIHVQQCRCRLRLSVLAPAGELKRPSSPPTRTQRKQLAARALLPAARCWIAAALEWPLRCNGTKQPRGAGKHYTIPFTIPRDLETPHASSIVCGAHSSTAL